MSAENLKRVREIVEAAVDLPAAQREAFIITKCGNDAQLLADVQSMLAAFEAVSRENFLAPQTTVTIEPIREKVGSRIGPDPTPQNPTPSTQRDTDQN